jgi:hypothetical protein
MVNVGYEVFDRQEIAREHVKTSHEPVEAWIERPITSGGNKLRQTRDGFGKQSKKMPSLTKV